MNPPQLSPWSRTWRYLLATGVGLLLWLVSVEDLAVRVPEAGADDHLGGVLLLDLAAGVAALLLLRLRRREPLLTALATAALSALSAFALGPASLALVSMAARPGAQRRRVIEATAAGLAWVGAAVLNEAAVRASLLGGDTDWGFLLAGTAVAVLVAVLLAVIGSYIAARRELYASLRERAETAEREQAARTAAAREAERTRIAREMHDVLAHRISLVAMHAGALGYRTDLTAAETAAAAGVIRDNAHLALAELREVLGVLRGREEGPEAPQPSLTQLRELLDAGAGEVGLAVEVPGGAVGLSQVPTTASRTAYRIVQEALTNARRHAAGAPVRVSLGGAPGGLLTVEVRNELPVPAPAAGGGGHGAGVGLTGLSERTQLAGGELEHGVGPDGSFTVRAWLPWEEPA